LHIRAEAPILDQNRLAALRVLPQYDRPVLLRTHQCLDRSRIQIPRRQIIRQAHRLPVAVDLPRQKRPILPNPHLDRQIGKIDPARMARVDVILPFLDLALQPLLTQIKLVQIFQPVYIPLRDVIQRLLHLRRELQVHQLLKVALQQLHDRKRNERGHQLLPLFENVAPVLNCVDDRGVRARAADPFRLQRSHQPRLRIARRRLRRVPHRLQLPAVHLLILGQHRQRRFLVLNRSIRIIRTFNVRPKESRKEDLPTRRPKQRLLVRAARAYHHRRGTQARIRHLRRHRPLPDHIVERRLIA